MQQLSKLLLKLSDNFRFICFPLTEWKWSIYSVKKGNIYLNITLRWQRGLITPFTVPPRTDVSQDFMLQGRVRKRMQ